MSRFYTILFLLIWTTAQSQWVNLNSQIPGELFSIEFDILSRGMAVGDSGVFSSLNSGSTWTKEVLIGSSSDSLVMANTRFKGLYQASNTWYAVGKDAATQNGVIFKKSASGVWTLVHSVSGKGLNDITIFTSKLVAVGEQGYVCYSSNQGTTWLQNTSGTTSDLNSISSISSMLVIGSNFEVLIGFQVPNLGFTAMLNTGVYDVALRSNQIVAGVSDASVFHGMAFSTINWPTNFNGPLNGRCFAFNSSNTGFIGSTHGIYRSFQNYDYWEIVPSAGADQINDIYFDVLGNGWAVGQNGLILKTTNNGGNANPYINFDLPNGVCVDSVFSTDNNCTPIGYTFQWKINNASIGSTFNVNTSIQDTGLSKVTLIASNGQLTDSISKFIRAVNVPLAIDSVYQSDTLFCKIGQAEISIFNTQPDVVYTLVNAKDSLFIDTALGNGSTIKLNTGIITDSTDFIIQIRHALADCILLHPDTIRIGVEKTKAIFHNSKINVGFNEFTQYYNHSKQANTYVWSFGTSAVVDSSTSKNPVASYNTTGSTSTQLVAISACGCRDTLIKAGPNVYNPSSITEDKWVMNLTGTNHDEAEHIHVTKNGDIIVSGNHAKMEFASRAGLTTGMQNDIGFFIARYSKKGVLKWYVKGVDNTISPSIQNSQGTISDFELDEEENIYAVGIFDEEYSVYSNDGVVTSLNLAPINNKGFVMKLDSNGAVLWSVAIQNGSGTALAMDNLNNLYICGNNQGTLIVNSTDGTTSTSTIFANKFIFKMTQNGLVSWLNPISNASSLYYFDVDDIGVDGKGNAYVVGQHSAKTYFHSSNGDTLITAPASSGSNGFIAKYDTQGNALWVNSINSYKGSISTFDQGLAVAVDKYGNSFTGMKLNGFANSSTYMIVPSQNGNVNQVSVGPYALLSYDENGNYRWANGNKYADDGRGTAVKVDKFGFVYAMGYAAYNTTNLGDFNSVTSKKVTLPMRKGSFFTIKYDRHGHLIWATLESNVSNQLVSNNYYPKSISVDSRQQPHGFVTISRFLGAGGYNIKGQLIYPDSDDPVIVKMSTSGSLQNDSIVALVSGDSYCKEDSLRIPFYVNPAATLNSGNVFTLQLSDMNGNFGSPLTIGTLQSNLYADTITGWIPTSLILTNANYQIRINSSNHNIEGNKTPIFIQPKPTHKNQSISICKGDSIQLVASDGRLFSWYPAQGLNNTISKSIYAAPDSSITYYCDVETLCKVVTDTFQITVNPTYLIEDSIPAICTADSILIYGKMQHLAGIYYDSLFTIHGCDSVHFTSLELLDTNYMLYPEVHICAGDSTAIFNVFRKYSGVYFETLQNKFGCDSLRRQELFVHQPDTTIALAANLCRGDSLLVFGVYRDSAGFYYDYKNSILGCDSILIQEVVFRDNSDTVLAAITLCSGDSIFFSGQFHSLPGIYVDTMSSYYGCDSIVQRQILLNPTHNDTLPALSICKGDSVLIFGQQKSIPGYYSNIFSNQFGCDSILYQQLTNLQVDSIWQTPLSICQGDSALVFGQYQTIPGIYLLTLTNQLGCDSMRFQQLIINPASTANLSPLQICQGDSAFIFGQYQTVAGNYMSALTNQYGCDSTVFQMLLVKPKYNFSLPTAEICQGEKYFFNGQWIELAGMYYDSNLTKYGCDSNFSIQLLVKAVDTAVVLQSTTLIAQANFGTYQWLDCNNAFAIIAGETNKVFAPTQNGEYAVAVSQNGCTDTSACHKVSTIGLNEKLVNRGISFYPNPTTGLINLELDATAEYIGVEITTSNGKIIGQEFFENVKSFKLELNQPAGDYYLKVTIDSREAVLLKIVLLK